MASRPRSSTGAPCETSTFSIGSSSRSRSESSNAGYPPSWTQEAEHTRRLAGSREQDVADDGGAVLGNPENNFATAAGLARHDAGRWRADRDGQRSPLDRARMGPQRGTVAVDERLCAARVPEDGKEDRHAPP